MFQKISCLSFATSLLALGTLTPANADTILGKCAGRFDKTSVTVIKKNSGAVYAMVLNPDGTSMRLEDTNGISYFLSSNAIVTQSKNFPSCMELDSTKTRKNYPDEEFWTLLICPSNKRGYDNGAFYASQMQPTDHPLECSKNLISKLKEITESTP